MELNKYVMTKERDGLEGLHLGEIFNLEDNSSDVATITSEITGRTFYVSNEIFKECFSKVIKISVNNSISEENVNKILNASDFRVFTAFDKCTIVSCQLPNGFIITESSSMVSSKDIGNVGIDICMRKIKDKVFELEEYFLQKILTNTSELYECEDNLSEECCGECCQGDCDHCCEE